MLNMFRDLPCPDVAFSKGTTEMIRTLDRIDLG